MWVSSSMTQSTSTSSKYTCASQEEHASPANTLDPRINEDKSNFGKQDLVMNAQEIEKNGDPNANAEEPPKPALSSSTFSLATRGVHADDRLNYYTDVAPALHVSTTFRYSSNPEDLVPVDYDVKDDETRSTTKHGPDSKTNQDTDIETKPNDEKSHQPGQGVSADAHVYSRLTAPNTTRLETLLTSLLNAPSLTYSSGLAAFHALLIHVRPRVVAIGAGYHGCHGVLAIYARLTGCRIVDLFDETTWSSTSSSSPSHSLSESNEPTSSPSHKASHREYALGPGDLVHLETPVNPTGNAYDVSHFAALAHARGAKLSVDTTFAPPPLLDAFAWGADFVMHSGTKYFGGHSDMLCGILAVNDRRHRHGPAHVENGGCKENNVNDAKKNDKKNRGGGEKGDAGEEWEKDYWGLFNDRVYLGSVLGSMEGWLGVRSVRTLELRVKRQSRSATKLVGFLAACLGQQQISPSTKRIESAGGQIRDRGGDDDEDEDGEEDEAIDHVTTKDPTTSSLQDVTVSDDIKKLVRSCVTGIHHASLQVDDQTWLLEQMPNGFGPVFSIDLTTARHARTLPSRLHLFHHATSLGGVESLIEWRRMSDNTVRETLCRVSVGVEDWRDLRDDLIQAFRSLSTR